MSCVDAELFAYAAPEVVKADICTLSSDIYSLGVVMHQLLTHEMPIRGELRAINVPSEAPEQVLCSWPPSCYHVHALPKASDCEVTVPLFVVPQRLRGTTSWSPRFYSGLPSLYCTLSVSVLRLLACFFPPLTFLSLIRLYDCSMRMSPLTFLQSSHLPKLVASELVGSNSEG